MSENNNTFISKEDGVNLLKIALGLASIPLAIKGGRKAFGRVATNLIQPTGYQGKIAQALQNLSPDTDLANIYKYGRNGLKDREIRKKIWLETGRDVNKPVYPSTKKEIRKESKKVLKRAINSVRKDIPVWEIPKPNTSRQAVPSRAVSYTHLTLPTPPYV